MTDLLIVARTRLGENAICLAGVDLKSGDMLRLQDSEGRNHTESAAFQVGDVWSVDYVPTETLQLPHSEDIKLIREPRFVRKMESLEIGSSLNELHRVNDGTPDRILDGLMEWIPASRGPFVSAAIEDSQNPGTRSLEIWKTDRTLHPVSASQQGKSVYFAAKLDGLDQIWKVPYIGTESPPTHIPKGSILSLSLARWWRPKEAAHVPERCYLQICNLLAKS